MIVILICCYYVEICKISVILVFISNLIRKKKIERGWEKLVFYIFIMEVCIML